MRRLPTFSKAALAAKCAFPWNGGIAWPEQITSDAANFGIAVHRAAELLALWGTAPLDAIAEHYGLHGSELKRFHLTVGWVADFIRGEREQWSFAAAEVAFAVDPFVDESRILEQDGPRDYSRARPAELCGTADLVTVVGEQLIVSDYKTGRYKMGADPSADAQMRALGYAAARAYGYDSVEVRLLNVDEGGVRMTRRLLDVIDLATIRLELLGVVRDTGEVHNPTPKPGSHCAQQWCPIASVCPATQKTIAQINPELQLTADIRSPEHAARLREQVAVAKKALAALDTAIKEYAKRHPIPLGNGKVLGQQERTRRTIECTPEAVAALGRYGVSGAVESSVNMAGIKRAVKGVCANGQAAGTMRAIMAELEKLGVVKTRTYTTIAEIKRQ